MEEPSRICDISSNHQVKVESSVMLDTPLRLVETIHGVGESSGVKEEPSGVSVLSSNPRGSIECSVSADTSLGIVYTISAVEDSSGAIEATSGFRAMSSTHQVKIESSILVDTSSGGVDSFSGVEESLGAVKEPDKVMDLVAIKEEPLEDIGYEEMETVQDENITKKRYPCPECGKGFDYKAHLRKHSRVHSGETPFVCTICKKGFKHVSHLRRHRSIHTCEKDICDICGKGFYEIGQHMKTHIRKTSKVTKNLADGSKVIIKIAERVPCPFCTNTYANKRYLKRHLLTHQNFRPYSCDFCDKRFYQSCDLKNHRRIHLKIKPYSCEHCSKSFRTLSNFKKHTRSSCKGKTIDISSINDSTLMCDETELIQEQNESDVD